MKGGRTGKEAGKGEEGKAIGGQKWEIYANRNNKIKTTGDFSTLLG